MKSNGNWLDLVAASKRNATPSRSSWSGPLYLDLLKRRGKGSAHASHGSKPTDSKSAKNPKQGSSLPPTDRGE